MGRRVIADVAAKMPAGKITINQAFKAGWMIAQAEWSGEIPKIHDEEMIVHYRAWRQVMKELR